jgi:spore coat polysaccharide biosynthesis protein SpsF
MRIGFLITARLKSSRLKLKLLLPLNGYTVIERVIQRGKSVIGCDDIVLCTSPSPQDLPLIRIAKQHDIYYYTGCPDDVLQRLLDASILFNLDFFIGITADNPLFSLHHTNVLSDMIRLNPALDFIYTTGMPIGANIYAMKVKALQTVCAVKEEIDTEIWGDLIKQPEIFNIQALPVTQEFIREPYRLTLDEYDDYHLFRALFQQFAKDEVIDLVAAYEYLDAHPDVATLNSNVVQRELDKVVKQRIDEYYSKHKKEIIDLKNTIYSKRV